MKLYQKLKISLVFGKSLFSFQDVIIIIVCSDYNLMSLHWLIEVFADLTSIRIYNLYVTVQKLG